MTAVQVMFLLATLFCSLVAGLLFTFAIVVMPGIAKLDDGGFLQAFQAIDRGNSFQKRYGPASIAALNVASALVPYLRATS